jgi:hypothetical protein
LALDAGLGTSTGAIYIGSATPAGGCGVYLHDLEISGANTQKAIYLDNANICRIERVRYEGLAIGIQMNESYFVQIHDCAFVTLATYGIVTLTKCHGLNVSRCGFYDVTGQCIMLDGAQPSYNINITENDFETFGCALQVNPGVHTLLFTGNYVEYGANALFLFGASSTGVVIEGNFLALSIATDMDFLTSGRFANNSLFDQSITAGTAGEGFLDGGGNYHSGTGGLPTLPTLLPASLQVSDTSVALISRLFSAAAATASPNSQFVRGRGTRASPAAVLSGDRLGAFTFGGQYDTTLGNTSNQAALIAQAAENWSGTNRGGRLGLETTPLASTTRREVVGVEADGKMLLNQPLGGLGYGTGAGGTVTQATSKSTGVTLNKVTGQITTHNASLGANTTVIFTVTNSVVAATDVVSLAIGSGGTAGAYQLWISATAAGSFNIALRNIAGALSEALVINFAVIKAVAA